MLRQSNFAFVICTPSAFGVVRGKKRRQRSGEHEIQEPRQGARGLGQVIHNRSMEADDGSISHRVDAVCERLVNRSEGCLNRLKHRINVIAAHESHVGDDQALGSKNILDDGVSNQRAARRLRLLRGGDVPHVLHLRK
jgi:hypothetical protein